MAEKLEFDLATRNNQLDEQLAKAVKTSDQLEESISSVVKTIGSKVTSNGISVAMSSANSEGVKLESTINNLFKELTKPAKTTSFQAALEKDKLSAQELSQGIGAAFQHAKTQSEQARKEIEKLSNVPLPVGNFKQLSASILESVKNSFSLQNVLSTASGFFVGNLLYDSFNKITGAIKSASKEAADFRLAQLQIETILPRNVKLTEELVDELDRLGQKYGTSATTQAKAYYDIISAGVEDAADGAKLLANANELATAGVTDTANTIDLLTTIYNVYGKELATTNEAADSLFRTAQVGKTNIQELSQSLGMALPIAKSFGITLDEVGAILSQLTNSGISTSESVTLLNAILSAIAKNGDKLGAGMNSAAVQTEGLGVVLDRLKTRTQGSNDALFELLGRQEAVRAVQSLTAKGLEEYNRNLGEFANKAGTAAEAAKKIIDGDVGKQVDILGEKFSSSGRKIAEIFLPAVLAATKGLNSLFDAPNLSSDQIDKSLENIRARIASLDDRFARGKISVDVYESSISKAEESLAKFSRMSETAGNPLTLISTGLEKEAANIQAQIGALKNGFTELQLGPLERDLKIEELNTKLAATTARIAELNKVNTGVSNIAIEAPSKRSDEAIANELKLQADLLAIRSQFAVEEEDLKNQLAAVATENEFTRKQAEIENTFSIEAQKLAILTQAELDKTNAIKDAQEKRLAQDKIFADAQLKALKLQSTKEIAEKQNATAQKTKFDKDYENNLASSLNTIATLQTSGNKTLVAVGKAAGLAQLAISGPVAIGKALELGPILGPIAATAIGAAIAAQAANIAGVKFEDGGIVGQTGATAGPDNRNATIRDGEMILNPEDQLTLFKNIKNGNLGGGPIIIQLNGREIARAVRDEIQGGFKLS